MSTSETALDWLLSLSAACTSSPIPTSSSPDQDFTDWLHISPRFDQSSPKSSQSSSSPPFQDVSFSSRVNVARSEDLGLNYAYDLPSDADIASQLQSRTGSTTLSGNRGEAQRYSVPTSFSHHNRMMSFQSTSATLVNTPSPHFRSPSGNVWRANDWSPYPTSVFFSPATKFVQELQDASFGNGVVSGPVPADSIMSDISPVVRAEKSEITASFDGTKASKTKKRRKEKKKSKTDSTQTFMEKLSSIPVPANPPNTPAPVNLVSPPIICSQNSSTMALAQPILLSPCKITDAQNPLFSSYTPPRESMFTSGLPSSFPVTIEESSASLRTTPSNRIPAPEQALSPLTPLTPLTPLPESSPPILPLKITLRLKRPNPQPQTPPRRSKRARRSIAIPSSPSTEARDHEDDDEPSPVIGAADALAPMFTNRTLPGTITISPTFTLFYRRFPASSYYQAPDTDSPCSLFGVAHPGGVYNPPRTALDLYTPRFVRGKGTEKVGLCPICIEPPERGGENKRHWLAMKFSAFKYYHMQYAHGISASTGRPFSPPTAFRIVPRVNPGKKEKTELMHGMCHKCAKWVAIEGIKDMESKVKELHWWKHAASCHQESALAGEGDYYEDDYVLKMLLTLQQ